MIEVAAALMLAAGVSDQAPASAGGIPDNVRVIRADVRGVVENLWRISPTFRRQCEAIGAAERVLVVIGRAEERLPSANGARLQLRRYDSGLIVGLIELPGLVHPEKIVHEFEHVLEQIEKRADQQSGRQPSLQLIETAPRTFESERAQAAERAALRDLSDADRMVRLLRRTLGRRGDGEAGRVK